MLGTLAMAANIASIKFLAIKRFITLKIYAVVLDKPNDSVWEKIKSGWPDTHYVHDERMAFVVDEDTKLTAEIAESAGIAEGVSGMVIQMDYFSGRSNSSLVEWINKRS